MTKNKLIYLRNVIYGLSKDFGFQLDLYRPTEITDYRTGKKTVTRVKYRINKAIVFPNSLFRDFSYAALLSTLNSNFQVGGLLDASERLILLSKKQLPRNFKIAKSDYIIFNHDRYNLEKYNEMELVDYWQIQMKQVVGEPTWEVHERHFRQKLELIETID